jgi:hypothetical protein
VSQNILWLEKLGTQLPEKKRSETLYEANIPCLPTVAVSCAWRRLPIYLGHIGQVSPFLALSGAEYWRARYFRLSKLKMYELLKPMFYVLVVLCALCDRRSLLTCHKKDLSNQQQTVNNGRNNYCRYPSRRKAEAD